VFVPAVQRNSVGPSYASGQTPGQSLPISSFFIARPSDSVQSINNALAWGQNLIFTPGVYDISQTIRVKRQDTIVLGLGMATLTAENGITAMTVEKPQGVEISGLIFDAGPVNSDTLLQVGTKHGGPHDASSASDPTLLSDVFFRVGGPHAGKVTTALEVNQDNTILDNLWIWRADHGAGVGWTSNTSDTGLIVNGDNVTAYGLFVEHFQKSEVIWNGKGGSDFFFQNEMPYDPPSQAAWMSSPTTDGFSAFVVSPNVTSFQGYGMGSYSFFNQGVPIFATQAFLSPNTPGVQFHDLLTIFLDAVHGSGGINSVINGVGGSSTAANADTPVDVTSYP
jgi:hypothetical protein